MNTWTRLNRVASTVLSLRYHWALCKTALVFPDTVRPADKLVTWQCIKSYEMAHVGDRTGGDLALIDDLLLFPNW